MAHCCCIYQVCELDFVVKVEECHWILDELCINGMVVDGSQANALAPVALAKKYS